MHRISRRYTDTSKPGSFLGLSGYKRNTTNKNYKQIEKSLLKINAFTLHKPKRLNYKRCKVIVAGIDEQWQIDLIDVKNIKGSNYGVSYIFTCIDVFSKRAWAKTLKVKKAISCKEAFEKIVKISNRKPKYILRWWQ